MLRVGTKHRVRSGGGGTQNEDKKKSKAKGIRSDTFTPSAIVHDPPPGNPYWKVIGMVNKDCSSGIGESTGFSL